MSRVLKTPAAERDLIEIGLYISKNNPGAADRLLDRIDARCQLLGEMPGIGTPGDEFGSSLRSSPVGKYLIFYRPIQEGIEIIRVLHGARDLRRIFGGRETED